MNRHSATLPRAWLDRLRRETQDCSKTAHAHEEDSALFADAPAGRIAEQRAPKADVLS